MTTQSKAYVAKEVILIALDSIANLKTENISKWNLPPRFLPGMKLIGNMLDVSKGYTLEALLAAIQSNDAGFCDENNTTCFQYKHQVRHQLRKLIEAGYIVAKTVPGQGKRLYYSRASTVSIYYKYTG